MNARLRYQLPVIGLGIWVASLCPLCGSGPTTAQAQQVSATRQVSADTATARLHISGMTCGSCPATARLALGKVAGVLKATVTLSDSLGVVRYNPRIVSPATIASELTRRTGYAAKVLDAGNKGRGRGAGG